MSNYVKAYGRCENCNKRSISYIPESYSWTEEARDQECCRFPRIKITEAIFAKESGTVEEAMELSKTIIE